MPALKLPPDPQFCGCMTGPNDPDPHCDECFGTGLYGEAKAKLFAAAPDMLAALKSLFHPANDLTPECKVAVMAAIDKAEAIKRARTTEELREVLAKE